MPRRNKVLIADDNEVLQRMWGKMLERAGFEAVPAFTREEAIVLFDAFREDMAAVVIDGRFSRDEEGLKITPAATITLAQHIRERFDGPIIASGSHDEDRRLMTEVAICTAECEKHRLVKCVLDLAVPTSARSTDW